MKEQVAATAERCAAYERQVADLSAELQRQRVPNNYVEQIKELNHSLEQVQASSLRQQPHESGVPRSANVDVTTVLRFLSQAMKHVVDLEGGTQGSTAPVSQVCAIS